MFGLKMELMACADLFGGTLEQSCIFPELIWYYQWYETLSNCLHHKSAVPQLFLLLIAANLAQAGCLGLKCSLWPVPAWIVVQRCKSLFSLTLYDSINDMKYFLTVCITLSRATAMLVVDCCQFGSSWMFELKMELMACADLVGGKKEQSYIFIDLIW